MTLERYLGYHFTPTSILIAEAFLSRRGNQLEWEIFKQPNYELPAEWLALYKEAIPNLYDTQNQVFGFQALPAVWTGLTQGRFHRYDTEFFRSLASGAYEKSALAEFTRFLRYSLVYHVKPQPDEHLHLTLAVEDLSDDELAAAHHLIQYKIELPSIFFTGAIAPQDAILRTVWYRSDPEAGDQSLMDKHILVIHIGYVYTEFTFWHNGMPEPPIRAQGMKQIDLGVCDTVQRTNGLAHTVDLGDLIIYAQRARADYEPGQERILIFQQRSDWIEMPEEEYLALIQSGVGDIVRRLNRAMHAHAGPLDEVILAGEGATFRPAVEQLRQALATFSLPEPRVLPHSAFACAQGAAAWSYEIRTSQNEAS